MVLVVLVLVYDPGSAGWLKWVVTAKLVCFVSLSNDDVDVYLMYVYLRTLKFYN